MNAEIANVLKNVKIDPADFTPYEGDDEVVSCEVPGGIALDVWKAISNLHTKTGIWPILRDGGFEFDADELAHDTDAPPEGDIESLLKARFSEIKHNYADELGPSARKLSMTEFAALADESGIFRFDPDENDADDSWPDEAPGPELNLKILRRWDTNETVESAQLTLVPVKHPWEAIQRLQFGGYNDCPMPSMLSAVFREWNKHYGTVPVTIATDVIEAFVARPPQTEAEAWRLAAEQWVTCEDIVSQGTQSVRGLAKVLWRSPTWYFWWD